MAANDYELLTDGPLCPIGYLAEPIGPTATTISIVGFQGVEGASVDLVVGMAVMINDEILRLDSATLPTLTVGRGCADTLPAKLHAANSVVWFFDNDVGTDGREYTAASTIGVKLLPFTGSGGAVPVEHAPPHALSFNWRFTRPYPPADIRCNGLPWDGEVKGFDEASNALTLAWSHRNRIVQADQLVAHTEASIPAEAGTTYSIKVCKPSGDVVRAANVTNTTWSYTSAQALADAIGATGYIELASMRDGFESFQKRVIDLVIGTGIPQISEFIFGGTAEVGAIVTLTLGTTVFTYTIAAEDTIDSIAWKVSELIKGDGDWVVSASNGVVLVTGKTRSAFAVHGIIERPGASTLGIVTLLQGASTTVPQVSEVDFDTTIDDTINLSVTIADQTFTYVTQPGDGAGSALAAIMSIINDAEEDVGFTPNSSFTRVVSLNDGSQRLMQLGAVGAPVNSRTMTSSDGGLTFTNTETTESVPWAGTRSTKYWDAKYGSRRFSIIYRPSTNTRQVITQDGLAEPVVTASTNAYPNTGMGDPLDIIAAYADTSQMYFVGAPKFGTDGLKMYLYSTTDGTLCTEIGELTLDPSVEPSTPGSISAFTAEAFNLGESSKLVKYGTRWFLMGYYGMFYCDEVVPLTNWKPTQLYPTAVNANFRRRFIEAAGSTIVVAVEQVQHAFYSTLQVVYSEDGGDTWTVLTTPGGTEQVFPTSFILADGSLFAYYNDDASPSVIRAAITTPATWARFATSGLPDLVFEEQPASEYDGSVILIYFDGEPKVYTATDGINFTPASIPGTVKVTNDLTATAAISGDKIVLTGTQVNDPFTVSAEWSLKPTTSMTYQTIREASDLGYATGMGEALGVNLGGLPA